jgi:hypothetical protein
VCITARVCSYVNSYAAAAVVNKSGVSVEVKACFGKAAAAVYGDALVLTSGSTSHHQVTALLKRTRARHHQASMQCTLAAANCMHGGIAAVDMQGSCEAVEM